MSKTIRYQIILSGVLVFLLLGTSHNVFATATVTPATGGSAISADTTGGTYSALTGPTISEGASRDISSVGTIILGAPSGFIFNIGQNVTATIARDSGNQSCFTFSAGTATPTASTVTFTVNSLDATGGTPGPCHVTFSGIQVRPSAGTPLASGNITESGTSSIVGINGTTNLGTLTEVIGAKSQLVITTQPSVSATAGIDFTTKPVVAVQDQFGNTVTSDSVSTIARTAVLSVCGGTAGSGTLTSTSASGAVVASGIMTYTAMQYSVAESIKICFSSSGLTSTPSNTVTVSNPTPTTTSISPTSKVKDSSGFPMTVNGTNFVSGAIVSFNGSARTTTFGGSTQLTAAILSSDLNTVGTFPITVFNPAPGGGISNPQTFTVTVSAPLDTTAPAAVSGLALSDATSSSILVSWLAPGDDNSTGTATTYDLRYSTSTITSVNFASAIQVTGEPTPSIAGSAQSMTVSGLSSSTTYFFALETSDEVPNTSTISNVPSLATTAGSTPTLTPTPTPTPGSGGSQSGNITVTQKVINDNGGTKTVSDFPLFINGELVISGEANTFPAPAPVFTVTETSDPNYTRTFSGDCDINGQLNLNPGDNKSCTVTNDDKAILYAFSNIDYNNDRKINLSDFSLFLSNWSSSKEATRARDDLNKDGKLNVSDFSLFLSSFQLGWGR